MNKFLLLAFLILIIGVPSAYAHPFLLDSEPSQAGNAVIGTTQIITKYSEAVEIDFSELKVFDGNGNTRTSEFTVETIVGGTEISYRLKINNRFIFNFIFVFF